MWSRTKRLEVQMHIQTSMVTLLVEAIRRGQVYRRSRHS